MNQTIVLDDEQRVKFLLNVVSEKLVESDIGFAEVLVSQWESLIDKDTLEKLSLSKDDLSKEIEADGLLKELADQYIKENPEDSQRLIEGMESFAGETFKVTLTLGIVGLLAIVLLGGNVNYIIKDDEGNPIGQISYGQSQETQEKILDTIKEAIPQAKQ